MRDSTPRLTLRGITKAYPGCLANDRVSLSLDAGEIHALLGENGAGKSTLMKVIYGVVKPDRGEVLWDGAPIQISSPAEARRFGIGMVFQHFSLFETLSITENIALALGNEAGDLDLLAERIKTVSERYGMALNPDRDVHTLSVGERQRVEIVRCLVQPIKLLILDEPTSVLTPQEVDALFVTLRKLAQDGCTILFISHKLNEVKALCHSATIMREGRVTGTCDPQIESTAHIAGLMVGIDTPLSTEYPKVTGGDASLSVKGLNLKSHEPFGIDLKNVSLEVRSGEIIGIAGVAGNGQEELLAALSGESPVNQTGTIFFGNTDISKLRPEQRRRMGLGFVPEERLGRGAVPEMSLTENALLTGYDIPLKQSGMINFTACKRFASEIVERFKVRCSGIDAEAQSLSGGNLQKFIIGREVLQSPKLLVAAHPTWGVDVGAATAIHQSLIALRDQGTAILVISEDIDELFMICDRLGAICNGELSGLKDTSNTTIAEIGRWMAGDFDKEVA